MEIDDVWDMEVNFLFWKIENEIVVIIMIKDVVEIKVN